MELKDILAKNLQMIAEYEGLSQRAMSIQCGVNQKSMWNTMNGVHAVRLSNLEEIANSLRVPASMLLMDGLTIDALMSIRSEQRMIDYLSLPREKRSRVDQLVRREIAESDEKPRLRVVAEVA